MSLSVLIFLMTISICFTRESYDLHKQFCHLLNDSSVHNISHILRVGDKIYLRVSNSDPSLYWIYDTKVETIIGTVSVDKLFPNSFSAVEHAAAVIGFPEYWNGNNLLIVIGRNKGRRGYVVYRISGEAFERHTDERILSALGLKSVAFFDFDAIATAITTADTIGTFWPEYILRIKNLDICGLTFYPRGQMYLFCHDDGHKRAKVLVRRTTIRALNTAFFNVDKIFDTILSIFELKNQLYVYQTVESENVLKAMNVGSNDRININSEIESAIRLFNCKRETVMTSTEMVTKTTKNSKTKVVLIVIAVLAIALVIITFLGIVFYICLSRRNK